MSEQQPMRWLPAALCLETGMTPDHGLERPNDWLGTDDDGQQVVGLRFASGGFAWAKPVTEGDSVEFMRGRLLCTALLTLAADGRWSVDRLPPTETDVVVYETSWAPSLKALAKRLHEVDPAPGTLQVSYVECGEDVTMVYRADPPRLEQIRTDASGNA